MKNYISQKAMELFKIDSPSGMTKAAMDYLESEVKAIGFSMEFTTKGNGFICIPGEQTHYTRAVSAHVDTLGLMVRSITEKGTLKLTAIGSPIIPTLDGEYCKIYTRDKKIYTGTIISIAPAIHVHPDATTIERTLDTIEVRLDEVVHSKADVEALSIATGDFVCYEPKMTITPSGYIKSRFIDDKISVIIFLALLKKIKTDNIKLATHTVFLFSTYEEVGHGMSFLPVKIEELLSVDMGCVGLDLNCTEQQVSICAKDSSGPYDYDLTSKLITLAKAKKLPFAVDIYPRYSSDTSAALKASNDIKGALIGPGVSASHGMERTHYEAVEATFELILEYLVSKV